MKELIEQYESYLKEMKKEESTIKMYVHEVKQFNVWLETRQIGLDQLKREDVLQFREHLVEKGNKVATINKLLSTLRSFLVWATKNHYVQVNIPENLRLHEEKPNTQVKWLNIDDESKLLEIMSHEKNPFKKARNEALIYVLLYAGLRVDELSQLHTNAISEKTITVYHDGKFSRDIPVDDQVIEKLHIWIEVRNKAGKSVYLDSPFMFVTERSGRMQPRSIQFVVEGYSDKLGFLITSQILRNTYCRRLVEKGFSVEHVKQFAGHKSIVTSYKFF
ncbi:tyrosine-type recombinase/integrase [Bacillus pinisoli]|uniref:tyrosine-type recombinase/integrase n=1 Tax=Bacillus pinisoli TaxID=2901866 RepID=UPI001FF61D2A|nr:tyrosine-type recombinase/integrase [Bacillus pinisoli]